MLIHAILILPVPASRISASTAMDELEQAILLAHDPSSDPNLRSQALAFCTGVRTSGDPSALVRLCLDLLLRSPHPPVLFWSLQSLHDCIVSSYPSFPPSTLPSIRSSLLSLFSGRLSSPSTPPFLKNKLAQCIVALIRTEYPAVWPIALIDLIPNSNLQPHAAPALNDMFARVLVVLDDDLLSQDYPRSAAELADAMRVKDAMRTQCISQIVRHWFEAVTLYRMSEPSVAVTLLDAARRYITWIDIGLVVNDAFLPLLFDLVISPITAGGLRLAAAGCLQSIILKRMDSRPKISLLRSLNLNRVFSLEPEMLIKLASLITTYASETLECYRKLGSSDPDGLSSLELLEASLPSVFYVTENCQEDEVDPAYLFDFLSDYVSTMKNPSEKQLSYLGQILQVIKSQMSYDQTYRASLDVLDKIGKEEEDQMAEHRKELFTIFRGICRVAPDATQMFIRNMLVSSLSSPGESDVEEAEIALTMFYRYGETVGEEGIKSGFGLLGELIRMLLMARFSCHKHRLVALVYLETVTKYIKFVQENTQYIPHLLGAYLDERGVHHSNLYVSRRASYLFMRAVKLLKAKLVPYLDTILQNLQDTVSTFTSLGWVDKEVKLSGTEDGSQIFEAIGLLIGMEDVPGEKQSNYLAALLNPLCQQIELVLSNAKLQQIDESSTKVLTLQQIIMALNALSKGFNERLVMSSRPAIGVMFKQTLDLVLKVLAIFSNVKPLRSKITSFLHRMIDILGPSIFPCLAVALKQLLVDNEAKDMVDFLLLINQTISKFKTSVGSILEDVYPDTASRAFLILSQDAFQAGPGGTTEELRELQELQKLLYSFLHVMASNDLSYVFLAPNCRQHLDAVMQLLLFTSSRHNDMQLRKACVQIFVRLIKDWCGNSSSEDKLPGFRNFVIEKFATDCCLYSVLDKSFDFRDANTLLLFGEIMTAQKVMYDKFRDEFVMTFVSKNLSAVHCSQDLAEQYYQKLQGNDLKALRSFYQSLIENLRQKQNGSLVFR
ncbi:Exportin-T [Rhynchospora pubera]|uniref:Exportin-T n=1 Tax=Rhynchospora pubera TaxID=906938 RepID=A0AAV8HCP1_9POAL|nr:Exportin-T [Rhynchospora pubera]